MRKSPPARQRTRKDQCGMPGFVRGGISEEITRSIFIPSLINPSIRRSTDKRLRRHIQYDSLGRARSARQDRANIIAAEIGSKEPPIKRANFVIDRNVGKEIGMKHFSRP